MNEPQRFDVAIKHGSLARIHRDVSWRERNRLVDFAFRHGFTYIVTDHVARVRGEGTYR